MSQEEQATMQEDRVTMQDRQDKQGKEEKAVEKSSFQGKLDLSAVSETMLCPLLARAVEAKRKDPQFHDEVATRIIDDLNYDFSKFKSKMNIWGCAARTVLFDEEVRNYIEAHPKATIVNLACGLDNRFARVDNGQIEWINVDFPSVMAIREAYVKDNPRKKEIAASAFDDLWLQAVTHKEEVLVIAEGFLMYITEEEVKKLFDKIAQTFGHVTLLLELMSKSMVTHQSHHEITKVTDARFTWGIQHTADFATLCPSYRYLYERNFTDGMKHYAPIFIRLIGPLLRPKNNRIGKFEKKD